MKKIVFALIGLSLLFASCSTGVDTSRNFLYAEKLDSTTVVIHDGTSKDTISLTGDDPFQSEIKKDLAKIEAGKGVLLLPVDEGRYEIIENSQEEAEKQQSNLKLGFLLGVVAEILLLIVLSAFKTEW